MAIKHFENSVSNSRGDRTLSVAGVAATESGGTYTPIDAYPGMMVTESALVPSSAFSGKKNPNTWYMVAANATTKLVDLYVCDPDVASYGAMGAFVAAFGANKYNLGMETLGVPQPAGEATRYTKIIEGGMYVWGDAWFSTAPSTNKYAVLNSSGLWAPQASAPTDGLYIEILDSVSFTVGAYAGGTGYYVKVKDAGPDLD